MRKSWDEYFMELAVKASERSTCDRLHVGAIIVKDNKLVATGYNGSVSGQPHCTDPTLPILEGGCLNGEGRCCRTIHAEANALLQAGDAAKGATVYVTHEPCENCTKLIAQSGIVRVVYMRAYHNIYNHFFTEGIQWDHLPLEDQSIG